MYTRNVQASQIVYSNGNHSVSIQLQTATPGQTSSDTNVYAYDTGGCIIRINVDCHDIQCVVSVGGHTGCNSGILFLRMGSTKVN